MGSIYIAAQILTLAVFTVFISDRRQKPGMVPLVNRKATKILKASYLFPIAAYAYSLFLVRNPNVQDWISLLVAVIATALVVRGKLDLGKHHTWTGYYLKGGQKIRKGIYAWLPHPMYTGIILMVSACSLVYITRLPWFLNMPALLSCVYVAAFLVMAARREDRVLGRAS